MQVGKANIQARSTENEWVPLHEAASRGHKDAVKELLSLNAPVNPRTKSNNLPSELARAGGHNDCADILGMTFSVTFSPYEVMLLQSYFGCNFDVCGGEVFSNVNT